MLLVLLVTQAAGDRQDLALPGAGSEADDPTEQQVGGCLQRSRGRQRAADARHAEHVGGACANAWPRDSRRCPRNPWPRRYSQGVLIEVNAHSLFSKWFSESGKLVSRLFAKIQVRWAVRLVAGRPSRQAGLRCLNLCPVRQRPAGRIAQPAGSQPSAATPACHPTICVQEVVEEPETLVFVLIDEVESLTAARWAIVATSTAEAQARVCGSGMLQRCVEWRKWHCAHPGQLCLKPWVATSLARPPGAHRASLLQEGCRGRIRAGGCHPRRQLAAHPPRPAQGLPQRDGADHQVRAGGLAGHADRAGHWAAQAGPGVLDGRNP